MEGVRWNGWREGGNKWMGERGTCACKDGMGILNGGSIDWEYSSVTYSVTPGRPWASHLYTPTHQILAKELVCQLQVLENNAHQFYKPKLFVVSICVYLHKGYEDQLARL